MSIESSKGVWKSGPGRGRVRPKGRQLDDLAWSQVQDLLGQRPRRRDLLIEFLHLIQDVDIENIRIGMRIQAVWKPKEEWTHSLENIKWFAPIDEPDVDVATLRFQES